MVSLLNIVSGNRVVAIDNKKGDWQNLKLMEILLENSLENISASIFVFFELGSNIFTYFCVDPYLAKRLVEVWRKRIIITIRALIQWHDITCKQMVK